MPDRFKTIIDAHVILRRDSKILMLRRAGSVDASGHLEAGENIVQTAIRETREETGITLDPAALRLVLSIHQRNPGTMHTRFGFVFEPEHWHGEPANSEPAKCSGFVWADPACPPADTVEYTAAILRAMGPLARHRPGPTDWRSPPANQERLSNRQREAWKECRKGSPTTSAVASSTQPSAK